MTALVRWLPVGVGAAVGVALAAGVLAIDAVLALCAGAAAAVLLVSPLQVAVLLLLSGPVGLALARVELGSGPLLVDRIGSLWFTVRLLPLQYRFSGWAITREDARSVWGRVAVLALVPVPVALALLLTPLPPATTGSFLVVLTVLAALDSRTRRARRSLAPFMSDGRMTRRSSAVVNRALAAPPSDPDSELIAWIGAHPEDTVALQLAAIRARARGDQTLAEEYEDDLVRLGADTWLLANNRLAELCLAVERGERPAGWPDDVPALEAALSERGLDPAVQETLALSHVLRGDVDGADSAINGGLRVASEAGVDGPGRAHLMATLALVRAAQRRPQDAADALRKARSINPQDPRWSATERCVGLLDAGRWPGALDTDDAS